MRRIYFLGLGFTVVLIAVGCSPRQSMRDQAPELVVELVTQPGPSIVGPATLNLLLSTGEGEPIENVDLVVKGDMAHPGMVPVIGDVEVTGPGLYSVHFEWTMAGSWIVNLSGELPDGRILIRTFDVLVETIE